MSIFPKAPRFPPEKPSDVPGPGLYNPKLHDPLDDQWRKGLLGIYKAPRSKEEDRGPDTFGLYNPDQTVGESAGPSRPRAISTHATPSKHLKEILRLEFKLQERENKITSMAESLKVSEQTVKDTRKALQRNESENQALQSELEHLRHQMKKVSNLQHQVSQLQGEHEKSKSRRDRELLHLKDELRQAEARATRYLSEKEELKQSLENLNSTIETERAANQSKSTRSSEILAKYLQQAIMDRDDTRRSLKLSEDLKRLDDVRNQKLMKERNSQVSELVEMLGAATEREECVYDVLDSLLETDNLVSNELEEDRNFIQSQLDFYQNEHQESQRYLRAQQDFFDSALAEERENYHTVLQGNNLLHIELKESESIKASIERSLLELSGAYGDLSTECIERLNELKRAHDELVTRDEKITDLTETVSDLNSEIDQLRSKIQILEETYSSATESWELQKSKLELSLEQSQQKFSQEQERRNKASSELLVAKQAEAALRGELNHAHNLMAQIEELETEVGRLSKINDLLMRQSNLNAEEADKIAKLNSELVSQKNPAQRVRVLDRMRRELKEEKENTAKLQNELWTAQSEIGKLKTELSAYQSVSHPTPVPRQNSTNSYQTFSRVEGLSRVERPPLRQIPSFDDNLNVAVARPSSMISLKERMDSEHVKLGRKAAMATPANQVEKKQSHVLPKPVGKGGRMLPPKQNPVPQLRREKSLNQISENTAGDISQGAVKMQGKMTLEELR